MRHRALDCGAWFVTHAVPVTHTCDIADVWLSDVHVLTPSVLDKENADDRHNCCAAMLLTPAL